MVVASHMRRAYQADSALAAEAELGALAVERDRTHPRRRSEPARGHGREPDRAAPAHPAHARADARSTIAIESVISICRAHASTVERWRDGTMALRCCAAGMVEAGSSSAGSTAMHLRSLRDTLEKATKPSVPPVMVRPSTPPDDHRPLPQFHGTRDVLRT